MRVLFTPYPSNAHLMPIVPMAWALQSAGHEVLITAHHSVVDTVAGYGLTPVSLGDTTGNEARIRDDAPTPRDPEIVLRYADLLGLDAADREHWIELYQYLLVAIADYVRLDLPEVTDLVEFARQWRPDLVIWDATFALGAVAARVSGAVHARWLLGSDCFAFSLDRLDEHRDELRAAGLPENPLADLIRPLADRYGVPVDRELLLGQWTLDPMPAGYGPTTSVTPIPMRNVPYHGGEPLQPWLREPPRRPRVALSLGESTRRFIPGDWDRTPRIMQALAGLDIEVIATLNDMQLQDVDRVPDNVRVIEWVPLTQLLPTCSAIIHHGGTGTFAAARASRVPQLVCDTGESILIRRQSPSADDTGTYRVGREFGVREKNEDDAPHFVLPAKSLEATLIANYVTSNRAGVVLNHRTQTVEEIRSELLRVLDDPRYRDGADHIYASWLATPSLADVVATLETLVPAAGVDHRTAPRPRPSAAAIRGEVGAR